MLFLPFHFGYWDRPGGDAPDGDGPRAANELTLTGWDPVSKQPLLKVAAVRVTKLADAAGPSPAPTVGGPAPVDPTAVPATVGRPAAEAVSRPEEP